MSSSHPGSLPPYASPPQGSVAALPPQPQAIQYGPCLVSLATHPGGPEFGILLGATASVLAGAIFVDHCSPISDTTVLSSMASGCDHVDHVRTQLPYALVVAVTGMIIGNVGTAYGLPAPLALLFGGLTLYFILRTFGRPVDSIPSRTS